MERGGAGNLQWINKGSDACLARHMPKANCPSGNATPQTAANRMEVIDFTIVKNRWEMLGATMLCGPWWLPLQGNQREKTKHKLADGLQMNAAQV